MNNFSINKNHSKVLLFLTLLFYKIIIEFIYLRVISPRFSYYGLTTEINWNNFIISLFLFLIFYLTIPKHKEYISTTIYNMIGLFLIIPALSYYWLNSQSTLYSMFLIVCMSIVSMILKWKRVYIIDSFKYAKLILSVVFLFYLISSVLIVISRGGIDYRAFSFETIYSLRAENNISGFVGYILNWCVKVFTPFFFAYFYYKKKTHLMILVIILQGMLYLSFGYKSYLFSIIFLILCLIIGKTKDFSVNFSFVYIAINLIASAFNILFNSSTLLDAIPFRMVFVPAQAQFQYYEYFSVHEKVHFADGVIGTLFSIESPYNMPMFNVISKAYYGEIFNQNTGIFGDAYGNGGFVAMIVIAIILGILLYLIDIVTNNIPKIITISAFSYMIFVFNDNSLLTSILTGGFGLLVLLFYLFNSELEYKKKTDVSI